MKLLYDQNLSRRLVQALADLFPKSEHVLTLGMDRSSDDKVWAYAGANGFIVASKDSDFHDRARLIGPPPKAVWLDCGNCPASHIEHLLRSNYEQLMDLHASDDAAVLVIR